MKPTRKQKNWVDAKYETCSCGSYRAVIDGLCADCHEEEYYCEVEHYYLDQINQLKNNNWINVKEKLPEIPEGKYGIPVIIATWDSVGEYQDIFEVSYVMTRNREGKPINKYFEKYGEDHKDFVQLAYGDGETIWFPIMDQITHWQYLPEPPKLED